MHTGYSCPSPEATSEEPAEDRRACSTAPGLNSALSQNNSLAEKASRATKEGAGCTSPMLGGGAGGLGLSHVELPRKQACNKECVGL